ncbi:MAG: LPS-assembly protein LptD, partial [Betaproteobacteria bacterium]|nr:LPS-assembly protein LptD [Betaproteobacteria bacterium]
SRQPNRTAQRYEARGVASRVSLEGEDRERFFNATYTTCKPDQDDWYLRVSELALDRARNDGTGYNARIEFKGVPILYVPYINFALNNERRSGFLAPTFGSSSGNGLEVSVPYYFNLAPNRDLTLTPKTYTRRGLQLGAEFRFLDKSYVGQLDTEILPADRVADRSRFLFSLRHFQNLSSSFSDWLGPGWSAALNVQKVSDDGYFRDLSTRIVNTSQTNLPRDLSVSYASDYGNLSTRFLSYQTLQDPRAAVPVPIPYRLAPQVAFNARPARWNGLEFNTTGEFTDFLHPTLPTGRRAFIYPSASYAIDRAYGFLIPKVGYHLTRYNLTGNEGIYRSQNRAVPIASLDSGLTFERPFSFLGQSLSQTLEPRLFFLYVPFRDQSTIPLFTTSETDFSFAQIFNENLFVGSDRISDAKQVTAAVTTRFIDNLSGIERLRAAIAQRYYFTPQRTTLSNASALGLSSVSQGNVSRSDLLVGVSGQLSDHWWLDSNFQYSTTRNEFQRNNIGTRYSDEFGRLVNLSYRFTRDALKQIDVSTQWPFGRLAPGWTLLARLNQSLKDRRLIEGLAGLEYNDGCWEFRLVVHRFANGTERYSNSIQFQLELKGLSKLGINPFDTLKQNIAGYKRSDDRGSAASGDVRY